MNNKVSISIQIILIIVAILSIVVSACFVINVEVYNGQNQALLIIIKTCTLASIFIILPVLLIAALNCIVHRGGNRDSK